MKVNHLFVLLVCLVYVPLVSGQSYGDDNMVETKGNGSVFGELNYNVTSGLGGSATILGLSKDYFLKLGALILLTTIVLSIRPFVLGYFFFFFCLVLLTEAMGILSIPSSLMIAILFLIILEMLSKKHYEGQ